MGGDALSPTPESTTRGGGLLPVGPGDGSIPSCHSDTGCILRHHEWSPAWVSPTFLPGCCAWGMQGWFLAFEVAPWAQSKGTVPDRIRAEQSPQLQPVALGVCGVLLLP